MKKRAYITITIISVLVLIICFILKPKDVTGWLFLYDSLLNLSFILITILVVSFIWFLFGGDPVEMIVQDSIKANKLYKDGYKTGLISAKKTSSEFATPQIWIDLIKKAKKNVDMMGYSLHSCSQSSEFSKALVCSANNGVNIRVMIMDNDNPCFDAGMNYDLNSLSPEIMKNEINSCERCVRTAINDLAKHKKNRIKFKKIKNGIVQMQIIRIDETVYITPYLYSEHTSDSPLFVCEDIKDGYFDKYISEFNTLWNKNS